MLRAERTKTAQPGTSWTAAASLCARPTLAFAVEGSEFSVKGDW